MTELKKRGKSDDGTVLDHFQSVSKPGSFSGITKLSKYISKSKKKIKKSLLGSDTYTLHTPIRKRFPRRKVIIAGQKQQLQMDLMDLSHLQKQNNGHKFILTVIDIFSKKAYAVAIKSKSAQDVLHAMKPIINTHYPNLLYLQTDRGKEFLNRHVQTYLHQKGIKHFFTYNDEIKAGIVERFNRTLKLKLWRYFTYSRSYRYIDVLSALVDSYNSTFHRTIGMSPKEVNNDNMEQVWWNIHNTLPLRKKPKFKIGDYVRIIMQIKQFQKEATPGWSKEIFRIREVLPTTPRTYSIEDLNKNKVVGSFYFEELQPVSLPKSDVYKIEKILTSKGKGENKKLFVKWDGYPDSFNSWISAKDLQNE